MRTLLHYHCVSPAYDGLDKGLDSLFRLPNGLREGQSRMARPTHPAASSGQRTDACWACNRCGERPTGPRSRLKSKDRSLCIQWRVFSRVDGFTRAYLRKAGTYWTYERALLHSIRRSYACHNRDIARNSIACSFHYAGDRRRLSGGRNSSTLSLSQTISEWLPKNHNSSR